MSSKERMEAVQKHNAGTSKLETSQLRKNIADDLEAQVKRLDTLRKGDNDRVALDITFGEFVKDAWGFGSLDDFYLTLGVNPGKNTVDQLLTSPELNNSYRWLVPEVFRSAIRLGLRKTPIYNNLIVDDIGVSQPSVTMPFINMSDATPKKIGEAETIPTGNVSFGQKTVKVSKVGTGIEVPDEVLQYVPLNMISLYLQDVGIKIGLALDTMAIDVLINGDQADGSESAPSIGVRDTANNVFAYKDFLGAWIRMSRLGRPVGGMLSGEDVALDILELPEFKALAGTGTLKNIELKTPVPSSQNYWIHGSMPAGKVMLIDPTGALLKLTAKALTVENDRIVNKQINGSYVSLTTGYANVFRDARLLIDKAVDFSTWPTWMDVSAAEIAPFKS